jgi:hypothetical protein
MTTRRLVDLALATGHTFVLALLPLLTVAATVTLTSGTEQFRTPVIVTIVLGTAVALWATRAFGGSLHARAAWLSAALIMLGGYSTVLSLVGSGNGAVLVHRPAVAATYTIAAFAIAMLVRRPWDRSRRHTNALTVLAVLLLAHVTLIFAWSGLRDRWRSADGLSRETLASSSQVNTYRHRPSRDVYFIVVDGFGREDTLKSLYGVDLEQFRSWLEKRGFYVPSQSGAPYAQTVLSLSAMLNMSYLDSMGSASRLGAGDRAMAVQLIEHNAMMASARAAGYRVLATPSEFAETSRFADVEGVVAQLEGLTEVEQAAVAMTPLAALIPTAELLDTHRRNVLSQFESLRKSRRSERPVFMFAHIVSPHPPFVFDAEGGPQPSTIPEFSFADGSHLGLTPGQYRSGYAQQVRFVAKKLEEVVTALLRRQGPTPVIVITGDHGPGSELHWDDPNATNLRERMTVFSAYLFPGVGSSEFHASMSPVNATRLLTNRYFGTHLSPVADRSWFSPWTRPFAFIPVVQ